jgi:aspartate-semialdehyde dehydrogenase
MVGGEMIRVLEERKFPVKRLVPLATERSVKKGLKAKFKGHGITVKETSDAAFNEVDLVLFAGGSNASQEYGWEAVRRGAVVIDNSSFFRMRADVPLIIPEVNIKALKRHQGLIANPNCSTIQLCVALKPIYVKFGIKRVVVTTFQSVSGTGKEAMEELREHTKSIVSGRKPTKPAVYPKEIAFNVLPHIDHFTENGYTKEEMKMVKETKKIFSDPNIQISATCVRVPVYIGHAESVNVETIRPVTADAVMKLLAKAPGVVVVDDEDPTEKDRFRRTYPLSIDAAGRDEVFVGRIRNDISVENGIDMWVVADNLRKGAALNAVQIAEFIFT